MSVTCDLFDKTPRDCENRAVALGVFDGVHIGHRAVIGELCDGKSTCTVLSLSGVPKEEGAPFFPAPDKTLLRSLGIDEWLTVPFCAVRDLSPEAFVNKILCDRLHAKRVCCGYDFRFGKGAVGNAETLKALCEKRGIAVTVIEAVTESGEPVSTRRLRRLLETGDVLAASRLLGRPFSLVGTVCRGNGNGKTLGTPTANFPLSRDLPLKKGVYASLCTVNGNSFFAVTDIGTHPTLGAGSVQAETHLLDFSGDLYGQTLTVLPVEYLREERAFSSLDALKAQIETDKAAVKARFTSTDTTTRAVFFDFDDTLQDRFCAFYAVSEELLAAYCPSDAETRAARAHDMTVLNKTGDTPVPAFFADVWKRWHWEGIASPQALAEEYQSRFALHTALFSDSRETLCELRRRGYRLGIITNGETLRQHRKLDVSGLLSLFDTVVVAEDVGLSKPDPAIFCRAAAQLYLSPSQCAMVGDRPDKDLDGARAAGMKPVFLAAFGQPPLADIPAVPSPSHLLPLFPPL